MRFDGIEVQAWSHDDQQFSMEVRFLAQPRTHAVGHEVPFGSLGWTISSYTWPYVAIQWAKYDLTPRVAL